MIKINENRNKSWWKSKSVWTGVAMIVVAAVSGIFGIDLKIETVTPILFGLLGIFLRLGMKDK